MVSSEPYFVSVWLLENRAACCHYKSDRYGMFVLNGVASQALSDIPLSIQALSDVKNAFCEGVED